MSASDGGPVTSRQFTMFEIGAGIVATVILGLAAALWASHTGGFADHEEDFDKHLLEFKALNDSVNALKTDMAVVRSQVDQNTRAIESNSQKLDQVLIALAGIDARLAKQADAEGVAQVVSF